MPISRKHPILIFVMLLIAGCASAPPQGYYTKQGTQRAYHIDGKWYQPVDSSNGYEEEGIASWYGKDFHGKKTSNGEIYNMHAMTAAHKTLPIGTYVKVTRLDNGKEAIVRVNDRGPFVKGRIIDLSYKAASELGIADSGTAKVEIAALGDAVGDKLIIRDYQHGNFMAQVGAFTVKSNATRLRDNMLKLFHYSRCFFNDFQEMLLQAFVWPVSCLTFLLFPPADGRLQNPSLIEAPLKYQPFRWYRVFYG